MTRTPEEEAAWGARLSDRELINAKNGTSYGPGTPLIHGATEDDRSWADYITQDGLRLGGEFLSVPESRIAIAAMRRALEWMEARG